MRNVILFIVDSLRYDRVFNPCIPKEHQLKGILDLAQKGTVFHKCINPANSSWMGVSSILMGTDQAYHHNTKRVWDKADGTTVSNRYGDPLFKVLENNGYKAGAFVSSDQDFCPLFHKVEENGETLWGADQDNVYMGKDRDANLKNFTEFINNAEKPFSCLFWGLDDHISNSEEGGIEGRIETYKKTSDTIHNVVETLKYYNMWANTDLYIVGNHGDTYYANSEETGETLYQHTTIPFHTTTHVPLIVHSDYLKNGDIHDLVSGVDIYSTILKSADINHVNQLEDSGSFDLKSKQRKFVISQNLFIKEEGGSFSITDSEYIYAQSRDKEFLFNHVLDNLNVCNLLKGEDFLVEHKDTVHPHLANWFTPEVLIQSRDKVKEFKEIAEKLRESGHLREPE